MSWKVPMTKKIMHIYRPIGDTTIMIEYEKREVEKCPTLDELQEIVGGLILHTNAKTRGGIVGFSASLRTPEQMDEDFLDYRAVSTMWLRKNKTATPRDFEFPQIVKKESWTKEK